MQRREILKVAFGAASLAAVDGGRSEVRAAEQAPSSASADTLYVHAGRGADANPGNKDQPLRTLAEAVRRVNQSAGDSPVTIVVAEGIYALGETVVIKPERRTFTRTARLTVRAEVLPDDPEWHTGRMPTLIHTMPLPSTWNGRPDPLGGAADGFLVETSRRGPGWGGSESQCLFIGDDLTNPLHVAIIAHGTGIDGHHCVFRGMEMSVVYWTGGSTGHAMRRCVCDGVYGSGVWTAGIASDFVYRKNVILNSN